MAAPAVREVSEYARLHQQSLTREQPNVRLVCAIATEACARGAERASCRLRHGEAAHRLLRTEAVKVIQTVERHMWGIRRDV